MKQWLYKCRFFPTLTTLFKTSLTDETLPLKNLTLNRNQKEFSTTGFKSKIPSSKYTMVIYYTCYTSSEKRLYYQRDILKHMTLHPTIMLTLSPTKPLFIVQEGRFSLLSRLLRLFIYLFIWGFTSLSTLYRSYHNG